jgi:replication factor A1
MFKGFMRLAVDKWGNVSSAPQPAAFQVKTDNNLSTVEYELVTINEGK